MTISSTTTQVSYTGDGGTVAFPVSYQFFGTTTSSELTVIERTIATSAEVTLTNGVEYTVSGGSGSTGTVTAAVAPADTVQWFITRNTSRTQGTDYVENDPFPAASHENALDRLTMINQEDNDRYDRTPHFRKSDTYAGGEPHLPVLADRLGKVLAFDVNGDFIPSTEDLSDIEDSITESAASAAAALVSENNAATSESNAADSETAAALSAAEAAASAQGWSAVNTLTTGTTNLETTDARKYYILDATGGTITANLPAIGTNDGILFGFEVSNVDNAITIVRDGTDTINGVAGNYSGLISVGQVIHFIGDDTSPDNWLATIISQVNSATDTSEGIVELATDAETATGTATDRAVTPANAAAHYSPRTRALTADTSTALTLALTDDGDIVTMTNAAANVLTVPANAAVAFAIGTQIDVIQGGAGATTITFDTGVTGNGVSAGSAALDAQYSAVTLVKIATDTWLLAGGHGGVA